MGLFFYCMGTCTTLHLVPFVCFFVVGYVHSGKFNSARAKFLQQFLSYVFQCSRLCSEQKKLIIKLIESSFQLVHIRIAVRLFSITYCGKLSASLVALVHFCSRLQHLNGSGCLFSTASPFMFENLMETCAICLFASQCNGNVSARASISIHTFTHKRDAK